MRSLSWEEKTPSKSVSNEIWNNKETWNWKKWNWRKFTPQENNLVVVGKKIVKKTALANVKNPEILHSEETRILMDTGSKWMYISKELAVNMQLRSHETQGNSKLNKEMKASIVPQIVELVQ